MTTVDKLRMEDTIFGTLLAQNRLHDAVLKEPLPRAGTFGFRGDIALAFQEQFADEARPPEYCVEQVLAFTDGSGKLPVLVGYLHNFAWLKDVVEVLGDLLVPGGGYVFFANNIDFLKKYTIELKDGITCYVLPLDESTVWKETLELVDVDKNDIKKLNGAAKLEYILDKVAAFKASFPTITYEQGVAEMEPVRNRNENRPV